MAEQKQPVYYVWQEISFEVGLVSYRSILPIYIAVYSYTFKLHIDFSIFVFLLSNTGLPPEEKNKTTFEQSNMEVNALFIPLCRCLSNFVRLFWNISRYIKAFMFNERYVYMNWESPQLKHLNQKVLLLGLGRWLRT